MSKFAIQMSASGRRDSQPGSSEHGVRKPPVPGEPAASRRLGGNATGGASRGGGRNHDVTHLGAAKETTELPPRAPARDPPTFQSHVVRRKLAEQLVLVA